MRFLEGAELPSDVRISTAPKARVGAKKVAKKVAKRAPKKAAKNAKPTVKKPTAP